MKFKLAAVAVAVLALSGCEVDKTKSGELPSVDVDVSADAGRLPEYDVDWASVDIGTTTETITVPKVVVVMEEEEVEVPYMDLNMPDEQGKKSKRSIVVEAEIKGNMQQLEIDKVYAKNRRLIVVSHLNSTDEPLEEGQTVRISDRIVINAPDLDVQHIIVGEKPRGDWNNQYTFVRNESALQARLEGASEIYSR
jgi:outer membrane murein-binding lipoprotein Lpp